MMIRLLDVVSVCLRLTRLSKKFRDLKYLTILSCLGFGLRQEGKARAEEKGNPVININALFNIHSITKKTT